MALTLFGSPHKLRTGDKVPDFSLYDQDKQLFHLKEHIGSKVLVIYFYPSDEGLVCTKEACAFRDHFEDFQQAGAMVIGINSGSPESHKSFQQHHRLPFTLLSDPKNKVLKQFGLSTFILTGRVTFVVGLDGKIAYTFDSMLSGSKHAEDALEIAKSLQG